MTAIENASTTSGAASAGARPKGADNGGNGAFSAIYDSFSREPADKRPAGALAVGSGQDGDGTNGPNNGQTGQERIAKEPASKGQNGKGSVHERHPAQRGTDLVANAPEDGDSTDTADTTDDLTRFLGISVNAEAAPAVSAAQARQSSAPLRRDVLPQMPGTSDADATQPGQAVRLVVIGRETHFAPVIAQAPNSAPAAPATPPVTALPDTDAALKSAKSKLTEAHFMGEETGEQPRRTVPTGSAAGSTVTGSAATVAVDAGLTETGALVRVADQIIRQARELNAATSANMGTGMPAPPESGGPVRILRLQLQPEHLGVVTARLRIVGGVLELRLTADRQQSVEVLQQDRDGLIEALRRAGYRAEIASIEFARSQAPQAPGHPSGHNGSGGQSPQGFAGQQGGGNQGHSSPGGNAGGSADNGAAGNRRSHQPGSVGKDDAATLQSHEPQAIYL